VPSHVAANFYNKGVPLRLLNVSVWGILWVVSTDPGVKTLADLKGEEVLLTYRKDMPDLVFSHLATARGLDPATDFKLRYLPNFPAVSQELLGGRAKHAMLAEPIATMALAKAARMNGGARRLYRAVDLQAEWGRVHGSAPQIPTAGICAMPAVARHPEVVAAFQQAYAAAIDWCKVHPKKAAGVVTRHISGLKPGPVAAALKNARLTFVPAQEAKPEVIAFYSVLKTLNPAKIGGQLPDDGFYWQDR
jgi:NitT/TauT family transport system substrate-binding protein